MALYVPSKAPKSASPSSVADQLLARHREAVARASTLAAATDHANVIVTLASLGDKLTPDHPVAKAIGYRKALALVAAHRRSELASYRRQSVRRLSMEGRKVREIAAELGISRQYVVKLRAELGAGRRR